MSVSLPAVMAGVVLTGHGDMDKQQYRTDLPVPVPGPDEVLIRVRAAGVNNTDINTRIGWYSKSGADADDASWAGKALEFPFIQGADACGEIVAVGSNIDAGRVGERVLIEPCLREADGQPLERFWYFGSECNGGFAQYTKVAARHAHAIHSQLTDTELASFPCSYSTAENMLTKARVAAGDTVLVTGASGGVGSAAVQLAKARGANVIAVTSPAKSDELLALGASRTVDRSENMISALGKDSVEVVIDLVAGDSWPDLLEVLKPGGRYAVAGAIAGPHVQLDVRTLYLKDLSFFGCTMLEPEVFPNLIKRIENNDIRPLVAHSLPLAQINEAQSLFLEKKHTGKIVLTVED
ncbi:alcohol dehydrogenase family protein [Parendozoicomonas haliclonae]|uniref:Phthiocerol synthesis polyketide synthase type I PpsC n=1 Tax=Parendozoicomonas haliclonae TaxID=1960125 RepID=A0A1X7AQM5_9GAMM|nr:alcohol dehydrogenase family protein [Parendozoicomonas haliclonae]SMA50614.1 Phthiocerol synthesis polyketide synthase type I PpsC [Parendozoicomonas haliclonae]